MADLSPGHARALLKFLSTSQVVGAEAPAFMECVAILRQIAASPSVGDTAVQDRSNDPSGM